MRRQVTVSLIAGLVGALLYAAVATGAFGGMILAYLAPLPLLFAGLATGVSGVAIAGAVTALLLIPFAGSVFALTYAATTWLPAAFIAKRLLTAVPTADGGTAWYPIGLVLGWLTAAAAAAILVGMLVLASSTGDPEAAVRGLLGDVLGAMAESQGAPAADAEPFIAGFAAVFPGLVACSWLLMFVVNGALAQGVVNGLGWSLRPSPRLVELELPNWLLWALAAAGLIAVALDGALGYTAANLSMVLAFPFFIQGLGVVHFGLARFRVGGMGRVLFYVILAVLWWVGILVMLLGLADQTFGIRRRLGPRPGDTKEDE